MKHLAIPPRSGWVEAVPWAGVSLIALLAMAVASPWIARAALGVLAVDGTTPLEWVSDGFGPRREYDAFASLFDSGDVVVITWPGCELGSPALTRLVSLASADTGAHAADGRRWFDSVSTGSAALERLIGPPLEMPRTEALDRLEGMLVGRDGRSTCMVVGFTDAGVAERRRAVAWLREQVAREARVDPASVHMAGPVADNVAIDRESAGSFNRFALPAAIVVLAVTWWALSSLLYAVAVFLVSLWSVGFAFAMLALVGDRMNAVLIVMPVLVLVLGVSGGIHLIHYLDEARTAGGRVGVAATGIRRAWLPCALSAGTTAIGLASLVVSQLEPIRTFGFHGAVGVLVALLATFLVVPGLYQRWPVPLGRRSGSIGRRSQFVASAVVRHAPRVVATLGVAMAVAAVGVPRIRTSVRIDTLFGAESPVIRDYRWIERSIGPLVPIEVVVGFGSDHEVRATERLDLVQAIEQRLAAIDPVSGVVSPASFLPELPAAGSVRSATQRAIAARRLERSLAEIEGLKYVRHGPGEGDEPPRRLWRVTARVPALSDVDYGDLLDVVRAEVDPLVEAAGGAARGITATYTGVMPLVHSIQNTLLGDLFRSFLAACCVIAVVMMVVERGIGAGLLAMVSNIFPMVLLFGVLGWTATPLDIGSVMTASIALGMAIDGTLHFLTFYRRARDAGGTSATAVHAAYAHCAGPLLQTTLVSGLGILVFAASSFAPTSRFAVMLALLLVAALVGDLVLLPAMLVSRLGRRLLPAGGRGAAG